MAVNVTLHPRLEAAMKSLGLAGVGHASDMSRTFLLSKVIASFDQVDPVSGSEPDINVTLMLSGAADALKWPFAAEPGSTFDLSNLIGDL